MTVHGVDATFSASWNSVEDFLARVGLDFDQTRTHQQIGTITATFQEAKSDDGGLTYIGIYGWTVDPLREFCILDDWGDEKPGGFSSDGTPRDEVGTLTADGEVYDVWKKTRVEKPSIQGTFDQYFSIRRTGRQCGTISISEHFNQWEGLDLPLGNLYEVKWLVEAQSNSGSVEFTEATVSTLSNNSFFSDYLSDMMSKPTWSQIVGVALQWETQASIGSVPADKLIMQSEHKCGNWASAGDARRKANQLVASGCMCSLRVSAPPQSGRPTSTRRARRCRQRSPCY